MLHVSAPEISVPVEPNELTWTVRNGIAAAMLTALAYWVGAQLGFAFTFGSAPVATLWPPNALLLAALLLTPRRYWWMLLVGAFGAHLLVELGSGVPLPMVLGWFVSNSFEAILGAALMRRLSPGRPRLDTVRAFWVFLLCVTFFATFASSFLDAGFVAWNNWGESGYWDVWRSRFCSNMLATQIIVPLVLAINALYLNHRSRKAKRRRVLEAAVLVGSVLLVCITAFMMSPQTLGLGPAILYAPLPLLVWAAVRFGTLGVSASLLTVTFSVLWGAVHGHGPFTSLAAAHSALSVQVFLFLISVPLSLLATVFEERSSALEEARNSQRLLTLTINAARIGLWSMDLETGTVWGDELTSEFFGRQRDESDNRLSWLKHIHVEDRAHLEATYAAASAADAPRDAGGDSPVVENVFRVMFPDRSTHWILSRGTVIRHGDGTAYRATGINMDITERRRIGQVLRESDEQLALAAATANIGFWSIDVATDELWLSGHCFTLLRLAPGTPVTPSAFAAIIPSAVFSDSVVPSDKQSQKRTKLAHEFPVRHGDEERWLASSAQLVRGPEGRHTRIIGVIRDITEQRHADQEARDRLHELAHLARVAMVGELSSTIVHEIGQPIGSVMFNAHAAQRLLEQDVVSVSDLREIMHDILRDNHRASEVIAQLRSLLRRDVMQREPLDITRVVRETLALAHSEFVKGNIDVTLALGDNVPRVLGNRTALEQVLLNLILNARDAMTDIPTEHRQLRVSVKGGQGRMVHLSFADTGTGITGDRLAHVFEPFFTSKSQGLGLGLAISRSIVKEHGGELHAENGKVGAVLHLTLPASD